MNLRLVLTYESELWLIKNNEQLLRDFERRMLRHAYKEVVEHDRCAVMLSSGPQKAECQKLENKNEGEVGTESTL